MARTGAKRTENYFLCRHLLLALCGLLLALSQPLGAEAPADQMVDKRVAEYVAGQYLPKYYPGDWQPIGDLTLYDLEGKTAAYVFVFKRVGSQVGSLSDVEAAVPQLHAAREQLANTLAASRASSSEAQEEAMADLRKSLKAANKALYHLEECATVLTGAWESDPLVHSCEPGIPPAIAERPGIEASIETFKHTSSLVLGRVLFLNAYDIRYELITPVQAKNFAAPVAPGQDVPSPNEAFVLTLDKKEGAQVSALRDEKMKFAAQKAYELQTMEELERSRYEKALEERRKVNIEKWRGFSARKPKPE